MIEVDSVSTWYGSFRALSNVTFTARPGSVTGLLGRNGAGKSSLLRTLAGCMAFEGSIRLSGVSLRSDPIGAKKLIGYLPERAPLYSELTVAEQLRFAAQVKSVSRAELESVVKGMAGRCGLSDRLDILIRQLSHGYRQRVGMAQALIGDPEILLLDEPTAALDPRQASEMRALIRAAAAGSTVILSTHLLSEAEALCSDLLVLESGAIKAADSVLSVRGATRTVDLHLSEPVGERAQDALAALGSVERVDGSLHLRVTLFGGVESVHLFDWAVQEGVRVSAIIPRRSPLEELFAGDGDGHV